MALKGDLRTLRSLKRALQKLPITATARIAARAAPEMTDLAGSAFDGGRTVYGTARPRGVDGRALDLVKSGASRRAMRFLATGRDIRTAILPKHVKFLIGPRRPGKEYQAGAAYGILPNGPLPARWRERLTEIAAQVLYDEIHAVKRGGGT